MGDNRIGNMARRLHLNLPAANTEEDTRSCNEILQQAIADRDRFLAANPSYMAYQREIDRVLSKAGTSENRMAVLAVMMEGKLCELSRQFRSLAGMLHMASSIVQEYSSAS